jgi:microcystin degradation protein MlrC
LSGCAVAPGEVCGFCFCILLFRICFGFRSSIFGFPMTRIGIGGIAIESCTFSPLFTESADFRETYRGDAMRVRYPFLAGPEFAERRDIAWVPLLHARSLPGGVVRRSVYDDLKAELLDRLSAALSLDGFYLDIHGAMAVEGLDDPEADLAAAIRDRVGPRCVISVSSDLHGNITPELLRHVDLITAYRTAPHEDVYETRARACRLLLACLDSGTRPVRAWVGIPVLVSGECSSTRVEPAAGLYAELPGAVRGPILDASLWVGYVWADTPRSMASCVVTGTDPDACRCLAERIAQRYWESREGFRFSVPAGSAAWCFEEALRRTERPVFVSDSGDNPTAGGAGDVTACLAACLDVPDFREGRQQAIYASMPDAAAVAQCMAAGEGAQVGLMLGGKLDPVHGKPLQADGTVRRLCPGDPVGGCLAVVQSGGVAIIVTERRKPYHRIADFTALGLDPSAAKAVIVKIGYLEPELHACARLSLLALTPGAVNQDTARLAYRRIRRPMFPMDRDFTWALRTSAV